MKYLLNISGGGTKGAGLASCGISVIEKYGQPHIYSGVSSGAIIAIPLLCGKYKEIENIFKNLKIKDFFDYNIKSPYRIGLALSKYFLYGDKFTGISSMNIVKKTIKSIVSEDEFHHLIVDSNIKVFVTVVSIVNGERRHIEISKLDYDEALDWIVASGSIPIFSKPYHGHWMDGGLRDHISGQFMIDCFSKQINHVVSIYSRPKDLYRSVTEKGNLFANLSSISLFEISKNDEENEIRFCKERGLTYEAYFLPKMLHSVYDTDHERLSKLFDASINLEPEIQITNDKK